MYNCFLKIRLNTTFKSSAFLMPFFFAFEEMIKSFADFLGLGGMPFEFGLECLF